MDKLILGLALFFSSCCNEESYLRKISNLNKQVDSLQIELNDSRVYIEYLRDEIQFREGEISLYGHQLDSCKAGMYKK